MFPCGLHVFVGKKGSGKTMMMARALWSVLAHTDRIVVSNLPILWQGAQAWCEQKNPEIGDIRKRFWLLDNNDRDQVRYFFLHRGFGWIIPCVTKKEWSQGRRPDLRYAYRYLETDGDVSHRKSILWMKPAELEAALVNGELERIAVSKLPKIQFGIDEIGAIFPSREFQDVLPIVGFYLDQQRKLSDDIICTLPNFERVDKQFRDLCDDMAVLNNWGRKQIGFFRLPRRVTWAKFEEKPGPGVRPLLRGTFAVDTTGLGETYDTAAGVGVEGHLDADINAKPGGIHWGWFIVILGCVILALTQAPGGLTWAFKWLLGTAMPGRIEAAAGTAGPVPLLAPGEEFVPPAVAVPAAEYGPAKKLAGMTANAHYVILWWADGTRSFSTEREFGGLVRDPLGRIAGAIWAGQVYSPTQNRPEPGKLR